MLEIRHQAVHDGQSIQEAYDDFFQESVILMRDSFYLWIIDLLGPEPGSTLLDVACAHGRLVELAQAQGINAMGLDLSFTGLQRGAQGTPDAGWVVANGRSIPMPDASIDYVTNIGSLEHYDEPVDGVREMARVLKPEGRAAILLPNVFGLLGNIRHVRRTGEVFDDRQPLQRYATRNTWEAMLGAGGLEILRMVPWGEVNHPRTPEDRRYTWTHPQKLVRAALAMMTPPNLANHFVFICRRAEGGPDVSYYPLLPYT